MKEIALRDTGKLTRYVSVRSLKNFTYSKLPKLKFFVHKPDFETGQIRPSGYNATEESTGLAVVVCCATVENALKEAKARIRGMSRREFMNAVKRAAETDPVVKVHREKWLKGEKK
jgi:hypothetical protein